ncbi:DUF6368 family protein [Streptomyces vietnamensis]|uniref:DUF6368 family protein n=1 Tax=Streptomyces vietnamensis TaxID=362257 RepID=UPI0037BB682E
MPTGATPRPRSPRWDHASGAISSSLIGTLSARPVGILSVAQQWFRHVGDVKFLAAWLQHPGFHLVK